MALAKALSQLGHRVVFHAMKVDAGIGLELGIEVNHLRVSRVPRKLQDLRFYRAIEKVRPTLQGLQITLSRVRAHDLLISGGTHRGYLRRTRKLAGPFDWVQTWLEQQAYRHTRHIIAHSDLLHDDLLNFYGLSADKITTLYAPVDERFLPPVFSASRNELRNRFGWPADKVVFLFPSSGHGRKGLAAMGEALRGYADRVLLAIAGKSPGAAKLPFSRYLGYVENLADAYHAADFTLLGSYYEPFGLVGPESLVCGTRLVFEQGIGCLSAVKPEYVISFNVWSRDSIRNALRRAIDLATTGSHHLPVSGDVLKYDASPIAHAKAVLHCVGVN